MVDGKLVGDNTWPFTALLDPIGPNAKPVDIVVGKNQIVYATYWGGSHDDMDSGETASGYPTKGHPDLLGCAIPMRVNNMAALHGSPIPYMPFGIKANGGPNPKGAFVRAYCPRTELTIVVPVIDLGPGKGATRDPKRPHALDLTIAAWKALGLEVGGNPEPIQYRILGAAHYVTGV